MTRLARVGDHQVMKPYSEDLRRRIVKAVQEGSMSKSGAARLFNVSLSSVKRYMRIANRAASLEPRKGGGRPRKVDETTEKLLEGDIEKRPAATISERRHFLEQLTGKSLGDSTIRRVLKQLGFSQKTDCGGAGTGRVAKSGLAGDGCAGDRPEEAGVRRRDGHQHFTLTLARLVAARRAGTLRGTP